MNSLNTIDGKKFDFFKTAQDIRTIVFADDTVSGLSKLLFRQINDNIIKSFNELKNLHSKIELNFEKVFEFCRSTREKLCLDEYRLPACYKHKFDSDDLEIFALIDFFCYCFTSFKIINELPDDILASELEKPGEIFDILCNANKLNGVLFENMTKIFSKVVYIQAGPIVLHGIELLIFNTFFVIEKHTNLAKFYYQRGNLLKYVEYFNKIILNFKQFQVQLLGPRGLLERYRKVYICITPNNDPCLMNLFQKCRDTLKNLNFPLTFNDRVIDLDISYTNESNPLCSTQVPTMHIGVFAGNRIFEALLAQNQNNLNVRSVAGLTALHIAALANSTEATKALLRNNNIDVNTQSDGGYTALHYATIQGNYEIVKILLAHQGIDVNKTTKYGKFTALHIAISLKNVEIVEAILENVNVNANATITWGDIGPLHLAAKVNETSIIKMLFEKNVDSNVKTNEGLTAEQIAEHFNCLEALQMFKNLEANKQQQQNNHFRIEEIKTATKFDECTAATTATANEFTHCDNVLKYLLKNHVNIASKTKSNENLYPKLLFDCENFDAIKFLLEHGFIDININDLGQKVALHAAAQAGDINVVEFLLSQGLDIEANNKNSITNNVEDANADIDDDDDDNNMTALFQATLKGHLEMIKLLVANGANIFTSTKLGKTVLHFAIMSGNLECFKYFVEIHKMDVHAQKIDRNGEESLLYFAAQLGSIEILKYLIEVKGLNPQFQIKNVNEKSLICAALISGDFETIKYLIEDQGVDITTDYRPLHFAIESNKLNIIEYLLNQGANIHARSTIEQMTSILIAAEKSNLEVFNFLLQHGANINDNGPKGSILHYAAEAVNIDVIKYLVDEMNFDINIKLLNQQTPFFQAAAFGNIDAVKYFVEEKNFSMLHRDENTNGIVLHQAALNKNLDVVRYFVEIQNLNIKSRDKYGYTPLFYAAKSNNLNVVKYFVADRKLGIHLKDKKNRSVLHVAALNGHLDVVRYLVEEHGGANINFKDNEGFTPIMLSIKNQNFELVKYLLSQDNLANEDLMENQHILHCAVQFGSLEIVKYFVEVKGLDVNAKDINERTPLSYAVPKNGFLFEYLCTKGASF